MTQDFVWYCHGQRDRDGHQHGRTPEDSLGPSIREIQHDLVSGENQSHNKGRGSCFLDLLKMKEVHSRSLQPHFLIPRQETGKRVGNRM